MARRKKPVDYVNELRLSSNVETSTLGGNLLEQYRRWTQTLRLEDLLVFLQTIQNNKNKIGAAQFFGKFRAYSLEEFVYRLIQAKVDAPKPLNVYWSERCVVWKDNSQEYGMELDVLVGKKLDEFVQPVVAVDTKVELDASRLKTMLAHFLLIKRCNPNVRCFLVYMLGEVDPLLLRLTEPWIDGIYQFSVGKDETAAFVKSVQAAIRQA